MTELQTNVNRVRVAYKLPEYAFSVIIPKVTGLGAWNTHVYEIRNALDEIGKTHDDWITLGANCPKADVLMQLRNMVQVVSEGSTPDVPDNPDTPDIPDIPEQSDMLMLLDSATNTKYKLYVMDGDLAMASATGDTSVSEFVLKDISTGYYYKLCVVGGKLAMDGATDPNDGNDHSQLVLRDYATSTYYKLYVTNGKLTMTITNG
jgi:hypothetical protein